jgi:hypothetical protein
LEGNPGQDESDLRVNGQDDSNTVFSRVETLEKRIQARMGATFKRATSVLIPLPQSDIVESRVED